MSEPILLDLKEHYDIFNFALLYESDIECIYIDQPAGLGDVLYTLGIGFFTCSARLCC